MTDSSIRACARCGKEIVGRHKKALYCTDRCGRDTTCTVPGCGAKSHGARLCSAHKARENGTRTSKISKHRAVPAGYASLYSRWSSIKTRCGNPRSKDFKYYGGRGITLCAEWEEFATFAKDMGLPPTPAHTIDRIDVDRGYEPGNCRWATRLEQTANSRNFMMTRAFVDTVRGMSESGCSQRGIQRTLACGDISVGRALLLSGIPTKRGGKCRIDEWFATREHA